MKKINILAFGFIALLIGLWYAPDDALNFGETHEHEVVATKCFAYGAKCIDLLICNDKYRVLGHGEHREATRRDSLKFSLIEYRPLRTKRDTTTFNVNKPK